MKKGIVFLAIVACVLLFAGTAMAQTVVFEDGFNTSVATYAINYEDAARQSGSLAPINWVEDARTASGVDDGLSQITTWTGWGQTTPKINLGVGGNWGVGNGLVWMSLDRNFNDLPVYEVEVRMAAWSMSGGNDVDPRVRYTGILVGGDSTGLQPDTATSGIAVCLTGDYHTTGTYPTWVVYDKGVAVASGNLGGPGTEYLDSFKVKIDNSGDSTVYSVYVNNITVVSNAVYLGGSKLANGYITLGSIQSVAGGAYLWAMYDDLKVTSLPAPPPPGTFADSFNSSANGTYYINYEDAIRQTGALAPLTWVEDARTSSGAADPLSQLVQYTTWGQTSTNLNLGAGDTWGFPNNSFTWASPNHNFNELNKYQVEVKMSAWSLSGGKFVDPRTRYSGILVGGDSTGLQPDTSTSGIAVCLTGNYNESETYPTWVVYDKGVYVASGNLGGPSTEYLESFKIGIDNSGDSTVYSVFINGVSFVKNAVYSGGKLANGYVTLAGLQTNVGGTYIWSMFDDFAVSSYTPPVSGSLIGKVNLLDYDGDITAIPVTVDLGIGFEPVVLNLDTWGYFTIDDVPNGSYDVRIKGSHWLTKQTSGFNVFGNSYMGSVDLINGDVVESNEVDFDDINATRAAYGSFPGDDNWNERADVDGSGEVDFTDINIVRSKYGEIGD